MRRPFTHLLALVGINACYVRLLNELPTPASVINSAGAVLANAPPSSAAGYVAAGPCGANLTLTSGAVSLQFSLSPPADAPTAHFSAVAFCRDDCALPSREVALRVLPDWEASYTDDEGVNRIDAAQLRVVHALGEPIHIHGVVTECFNCALPRLTSAPLAPGEPWVLEGASCAYPYNFSARSAASGAALASLTFALNEHGAYTLVLHAAGGGTLLEDVAGRNASLPLLYAALALAALGALHKVAGAALVAAYHGHAPPAPAKRGEVTLLSFWGFDKLLARAAAAAGAGAGGGSDGGGLGAALLRAEGAGRGGEALVSPSGSLQQDPTPLKEGSAPLGEPQKKERLHSLDAFRGFSLTIMIFVRFRQRQGALPPRADLSPISASPFAPPPTPPPPLFRR
jgi:hypothetical protein